MNVIRHASCSGDSQTYKSLQLIESKQSIHVKTIESQVLEYCFFPKIWIQCTREISSLKQQRSPAIIISLYLLEFRFDILRSWHYILSCCVFVIYLSFSHATKRLKGPNRSPSHATTGSIGQLFYLPHGLCMARLRTFPNVMHTIPAHALSSDISSETNYKKREHKKYLEK